MLRIFNQVEKKRLNGYRKGGHTYLVGNKVPFQCCKLPLQLPDHILPMPGLRSIPNDFLKKEFEEDTVGSVRHCVQNKCSVLPSFDKEGKGPAGFMWINERDYPSAGMWFSEVRQGQVQLDCQGMLAPETLKNKFILLAHRQAIVDYSDGAFGWVDSDTREAHTTVKYFPGIFAMFLCTDVEYILGSRNPDAKLKKLYTSYQELGRRLVNVIMDERIQKEGFADVVENIE
jgi:hypothetical protein